MLAQLTEGELKSLEPKTGLTSEIAGHDLGSIFTRLMPYVFALAGMGLLLYLLYGGFHLMTSGGDPKVVAEAKGKITNALIGFIIIFTAFWIVQIFARVFGLTPIVNIF